MVGYVATAWHAVEDGPSYLKPLFYSGLAAPTITTHLETFIRSRIHDEEIRLRKERRGW